MKVADGEQALKAEATDDAEESSSDEDTTTKSEATTDDDGPCRLYVGVAALVFLGLGSLLLGYHLLSSVHHRRDPGYRRNSFLGGFITNAQGCRRVKWTNTTLTVEEALNMTFPFGKGWPNASFGGGPVMTQEVVAEWVKEELLNSYDPFARPDEDRQAPGATQDHGDDANGTVPIPSSITAGESDQLERGHWVGYSRRQVCYIVAKSLMGAHTMGYKNGLARMLALRVEKEDEEPCTARSGEFGVAWWNLLTACAADPALQDGKQGPMILVIKARAQTKMENVRAAAGYAPLEDARIRVCHYSDGLNGKSTLRPVPDEACRQPTADGPGIDFMARMNTDGQVLMDLSESPFLGGYVYGNACGLGGGQDERLMVYMPEVSTLTFFLSEDPGHPQLHQPIWILGARMLMVGLDGTARFDHKMQLDPNLTFEEDYVEVTLEGTPYNMSSSRPFLAFMSANQGYLNESNLVGDELVDNLHLARRNKHPAQRRVEDGFEKQVQTWYSAVALTSYDEAVRPLLRKLVKSMNTGPFIAGLAWGDSQLGFLAAWIGHAIASGTWGKDGGVPLNYYMYSDFTENPGNQCFLHSDDYCKKCLDRCEENPPPPSAYWMPVYAFFKPEEKKVEPVQTANHTEKSRHRRAARRRPPGLRRVQRRHRREERKENSTNATARNHTGHPRTHEKNPCVLDSHKACGQKGLQDIVQWFEKKHKANDLWERIEEALRPKPGDSPEDIKSVFDLLLLPSDAE